VIHLVTLPLSPVSIQTQSLALRALRELRLDGNRAKRKRLRWQAANHGCHYTVSERDWVEWFLPVT